MAPRKLAAGNWKMNGDLAALSQIDALIAARPDPGCDVLICPPALLIQPMKARIGAHPIALGGQDCHARAFGAHTGDIAAVRERVEQVSDALGRRIKILVGKPGLDGHSNGAEQIAVRARDAGMEVVYEGIRLTPEQIVAAARDEAVHVVGLSVLSGSHVALVTDVMDLMRAEGLDDIPVVAGGIIPPADAETLKAAGVARVYTPKDFDLTAIMDQIVDLAAEGLKTAAE